MPHFLNAKFVYYFNLCLFVCLTAIAIIACVWASVQFKNSYEANFVEADPALDLPRYYGSCSGLVRLTYNALEENHYLLSHLSDNKHQNQLTYKVRIIAVIANAFTYSNTCRDSEAIGLMLTSDANITLDAAFNQIITFNEAVPLARSYYREAAKLGYFNDHQIQALLLQERIERNQFRVTIKAPF